MPRLPKPTLTVAVCVMEVVVVSLTVTVWEPAVFNVTLKTPNPAVSPELEGSTAWGLLPLKWTLPP